MMVSALYAGYPQDAFATVNEVQAVMQSNLYPFFVMATRKINTIYRAGIRDRTLQEDRRCDKISAVLYLDYENNNRRKIEYEKSENL